MNERPELDKLKGAGKLEPDAHYFRQRADHCRRLARSIYLLNDPTAASLFALAVEFDNRAEALEALNEES
jgi:hypothetical protein